VKPDQGTRAGQVLRWVVLVAAGVAYSLLAYRASASATPDPFSALLAITPLAVFALVMAWRSAHRHLWLALWVSGAAALFLVNAWLLTHYHWVFLLQHAGIYALLCAAFGRTLQAGKTPLVTVFARLVHTTMTPALDSYTRAVTWAWTIYFGAVAVLSVLLFWLAPLAVWSVFANLLGAPLLALMFVGEYAVRCFVLPAEDRAGPLEAIRAYRQASSRARQP
jgi:uncharacterized membrane protein